MVSQHAFKRAPCNARLKLIPKVLIAFTAHRVMEDWSVFEGAKRARENMLSRKRGADELPLAVNALMQHLFKH
jgi:hypothetical protein